jgi:hypothetical protein
MINTYSNGFSMGITGASRAPQHNHGPLVNSGPTRNRNRSRRKKRSVAQKAQRHRNNKKQFVWLILIKRRNLLCQTQTAQALP